MENKINIYNYQELSLAINLIKKYEGLSLAPYINIYGEYAIGYGTTGRHLNNANITIDEANILLRSDVLNTSAKLLELLQHHNYELNNNQFNAFVSFFNSNYFEESMKHRFMIGEKIYKIIEGIPLYTSINNRHSIQLKERRIEEYNLAKR